MNLARCPLDGCFSDHIKNGQYECRRCGHRFTPGETDGLTSPQRGPLPTPARRPSMRLGESSGLVANAKFRARIFQERLNNQRTYMEGMYPHRPLVNEFNIDGAPDLSRIDLTGIDVNSSLVKSALQRSIIAAQTLKKPLREVIRV